MVIYEQILPHDPFGQTMINHLKSRGCPLLSVESWPDLQAQQVLCCCCCCCCFARFFCSWPHCGVSFLAFLSFLPSSSLLLSESLS
jgi:hypothetical protein